METKTDIKEEEAIQTGQENSQEKLKEKQKRISNENILEVVLELKEHLKKIREEVDSIKGMVGFNDKAISLPPRGNMNNDPGPFSNQKLA